MQHISIAQLYEDIQRRMSSLRKDQAAVSQSRQIIDDAISKNSVIYGVNTGFGALASKQIDHDSLQQLQHNLLLSHAVGVGDAIPYEIARLILQLKIHALGLGYSGVSESTFQRLLWLEESEIIPWMPSRGSVGASGDLAPLAHMSLPLIGQGHVWQDGQVCPTSKVLNEHGVEPIQLRAKDGLALINGTQMMSSYAAFVLHRCQTLTGLADLLGAMSLEALQGSVRPLDARIHEVRPHPGQAVSATNMRNLLEHSEILDSHRDCGKVQDPYSLRCIPQVHGAVRDAIVYSTSVVETEINSVTDNPLVFGDGTIISGGNFHGQPIALTIDFAAIALAELASISERRIYLLLEGHDGLPKLLMNETGVNSGFMIPQYTAAALVSENKVLCHPASVDSIPTSLGQEDHVSMGSIGALKLLQVLSNVEHVLAIELLTASQALDFRLPLQPGRGVAIAHEFVRQQIPHRDLDASFHDDFSNALRLTMTSDLIDRVRNEVSLL